MSSVIKRIVGSVWALEDGDAVSVNSDGVIGFTRQLLSLVAQSSDAPRLSVLKPSSDYPLILELNRALVGQLGRGFFLDGVRGIKGYSVTKFFRPPEEEILEYFASVIDILLRPLYVKHLRLQLDNPRHLHGLSRAVVKHLWAVSLFAFLWAKDKNVARDLARAGLYHDITLQGNKSYIADFQHPVSGAEIARQLNEPESVVVAVEQHLFPDILRLRRLPSSRTTLLLLFSDVVVATAERCISIGLKLKQFIGR